MHTKHFAIFGNTFQPAKASAVQELLSLLYARQAEVAVDARFLKFITDTMHLRLPAGIGVISGNDFHADMVISMGGDGTFLEAAMRVGSKEIPILGINMGRLGFLSDITPAELAATIEQVYAGDYSVDERRVLQLTYSKGTPEGYPFALNEVAVLKRDVSSMISIRVEVGGEYLTTYQADGLIVCTPTGSTGYALSVGGPIMQPGSHTLGLTPVAPHSLTARPITLTDDVVIRLDVAARNHRFLVSVDGRSEKCDESVSLTIQRAPYTVRVVKRRGQSFFRTLRTKLMWGSDLRENM